ncbi:hypothetical protein ACN47E_005761 [Coniothyrium glycines]
MVAAILRLAPLVLFASISHVYAVFDILAFPSDATDYVCPGMNSTCIPPNICAHQFALDRYYCCHPLQGECVVDPSVCGAREERPSSNQQSCQNSDATTFCCEKDGERCTEVEGEALCWSTEQNLVANFSKTVMNRTFSALTSANPSVTAWTVSLGDFSKTPLPTSSIAIPVQSSPPVVRKGPSLSKDVIGVIVGGVVGGFILGGLAMLVLWRRRQIIKRARGRTHDLADSDDEFPALPEIKQPIIAEAPIREAGELAGDVKIPAEMSTDRELPVEATGDETYPFEVEAVSPIEMDGTNAKPRSPPHPTTLTKI